MTTTLTVPLVAGRKSVPTIVPDPKLHSPRDEEEWGGGVLVLLVGILIGVGAVLFSAAISWWIFK